MLKDLLKTKSKKEIQEILQISSATLSRRIKFEGLTQPNFGANKLNHEKAMEIRNLYEAGMKQSKIAKRYGVTQATIGRIVNNITYKVDVNIGGNAIIKVGYSWQSETKMEVSLKFRDRIF